MILLTLLEKAWPYISIALASFGFTFILTPVVREMNRKLGMVDKPGERRINTVPVPRGGGLALVIGVLAAFVIFMAATDRAPATAIGLGAASFWKLCLLSAAIAALGYVDDKFSLPPVWKLVGQLAIASLVWLWADLGFHRIFPSLPAWLDFMITVFWIIGAVNAFNLIDGLDGLASGLALIATLGMACALILKNRAEASLFHFAFAGGLLAFLRYNYNPASVFLGDCGSMFIGFMLSILPIATQTENSFLVSVGVPLLAMGVPIFDTALAIVRRSLRHMLIKRNSKENTNGKVMTADADHLHHRILRAAKLNQRKAAWVLYIFAMFLVAVGLCGIVFRSRSVGLWLFALATASVVVFKDLSRIELFDAGRLLSSVARDRTRTSRRKLARISIVFYLIFDMSALIALFLLSYWVLQLNVTEKDLRVVMPVYVISVFLSLIFCRVYRTVWARAMSSNYARLMLACFFGSAIGAIAVYYLPGIDPKEQKAMAVLYAFSTTVGLTVVRLLRGMVRDLIYSIDCSRLKGRKDVSRILVYGCGLRYRAFRRELVRKAHDNDRIIVGLLDDDILIRGNYIGGIKVCGTLLQAPEIINALNVDAVVIACEVRPEWMKVVLQTLKPTGVKITHFNFSEKEIES